MAYATGDVILDTHYNGFVNDINAIWGTGTGNTGYGQTASTLATVSDGTTITALQWSNLLDKMDTIASHQGVGITGITNPAATEVISHLSALETDISTLQSGVPSVNSFDAGSTATTGVVTQSATWSTSTTCTRRLTFAGGNEARWFFNAGGKLTVDFGYVKTTSDAKALEWEALVAECGGYEVFASSAGKVGGSGVPATNNSVGYFSLTTTPTINFKQLSGTSPYTANYIQVSTSVGAADGDGLGNNGAYVDFFVEYVDDAADTTYDLAANTNLDIMDGTVTTTFTVVPPDIAFLPQGATWGSPDWSTVGSDTQS